MPGIRKGSERNSTGGNWHRIDVGTPQSIHEYRGLFRVRNFSPRGLVVRRSDGKIQERTGLTWLQVPDKTRLARMEFQVAR
jgi:hypothetical protein